MRWPIFRPGRGCVFPVQVELHVRESTGGRPVRLALGPQLPEQIRHRCRLQQLGRAEREAADRAHLLLELTRHRRIERQVAGVVGPRRQFVHQQVAFGGQEELDA